MAALAALLIARNPHGNPVVMGGLAAVRAVDLATARLAALEQRAATTAAQAAIMARQGLALVVAVRAL